jgi:hypothetical protein
MVQVVPGDDSGDFSGNRTVNVAPLPGSDSTLIVPPCFLVMMV